MSVDRGMLPAVVQPMQKQAREKGMHYVCFLGKSQCLPVPSHIATRINPQAWIHNVLLKQKHKLELILKLDHFCALNIICLTCLSICLIVMWAVVDLIH